MNRTATTLRWATLAAGLMTASAVAGPPRILDRIPADAPVVVAIPSLDELSKDLQGMLLAAEFPMAGFVDANQLLLMTGLGGMVETNRSLAMFMPEMPANAEQAPTFIALVPVSDLKMLAQSLEGTQAGDIYQVTNDGETLYMREVGDGYVAASSTEGAVDRFKLDDGQMNDHLETFGNAGERLMAESSLFAFVDLSAVEPMIDQMKDLMMEAGGAGMPGADGLAMVNENPIGEWLQERMIEDGETMVAGMIPGGNGLSLQMTMTFEDGSPMAKVFGADADASRLMARLPNQPFLAAFAIDAKSEPVREMLQELYQSQADNAEMPNFMFPSFEDVTGQSVVIGMAPGAIMGAGILANTVSYIESSKPGEYAESIEEALEDMDGMDAMGVSIYTGYESNKTTVAGLETDAWSARFQPDGSDPQVAQMTGMMFGPTMGPDGYLARSSDCVIQTFSKNSPLLQAAIETSRGGGTSLTAGTPTVEAVGNYLPANRIFEGYLGVDAAAKAVGPMVAAMMGIQMDFPDTIPPVGFGVGSKDGAAHIGVFIPTPVLKVASSVWTGMMFAGGPMGGAPMNEFAGEDEEAGQREY